MQHLCYLAPPVMLTYVLGFLPGVVSLIVVGHSDAADVQLVLGAASLADMYFNVTGYSIGLGLASAMDTLCSQAYGAGNLQRIGVLLQSGLLVLSVLFLPILLLHLFATDLLLALHQPERVAVLAGAYARWLVLGLPFAFVYELLKKTLQAQNVALPMVYCTLVGNAVNAIVGYVLVHHSAYGFLGAAIGRSAANIAQPLCLGVYYWWHPNARAFWPGWNWRCAAAGVGEFLVYGAPGMLMMMFEWCSFEFIAILSGLLPNAIVSIVLDWLYYGIAVSATVRVGNAIGSNDPTRAKIALKAVLVAAACFATLLMGLLYLARQAYPLVFTRDAEIASLASEVGLVVVAFQLPQAINQTTQGILRGCGLQGKGAVINFVAYLIVGLPLGYALAFPWQLDLPGLWIGMVFAFLTAATIGLGLLKCASIDRISDKAAAVAKTTRS
ncbi:hypothetical protein SPRG_11253 [Saprolegnia parasitica CBS 223.65]|uniref:MATE efflux family protein n=1 Tax=Saprolegnia parasitica (strain CBS 223.65) TaxID=695850 RepID=A0A067CBB8_SAPPC|nr:hypothetical protein SPRG_11253 [Saprolegnia parasitica CBS 223.65]KDO23821.1 hypothetical protein SPRG_11253 [Saprolegnia parasitica CBS 223.65]|eukprot:XP_012205454.1 hypothetical protein SPRG_11253 [Saprolegnia parasitica CBS 223.65]